MKQTPQSPCPKKIRAWLDSLFVGEDLDPGDGRQLFAHLESCEGCKSEYNQIMLTSRMLQSGDALQASSAEFTSVKAALFGQLDHEAAKQAKQPAAKTANPKLKWFWGVLAGAAAATAIAIFALKIPATEPATETSPSAFAIRGNTSGGDTSAGLRVFCLDAKSGEPTEIKPLSAAQELQSCQLNQVLRFAYSNRSQRGFLYLLGIDEKYQPYWYAPAPPERQSVVIAKGVADQALERAVSLQVNHRPGLLRIFALFSERPLTAATIQKALSRVKDKKNSLAELSELPIANIAQRSLLLGLQ